MDKIKVKQKVYGLKGSEMGGVEYCQPKESVAIGEYEKEEEAC